MKQEEFYQILSNASCLTYHTSFSFRHPSCCNYYIDKVPPPVCLDFRWVKLELFCVYEANPTLG